jgi:hypothetical protein
MTKKEFSNLDNNNKFIYFYCACATPIQTHEGFNRPGATIPGTSNIEELCKLVSQRPCVLVSTDPKDVCHFQFCVLLHQGIVSPVMPNIFCCYVVICVCVPLFPCTFIESDLLCFISCCVSLPVFRCLDPMPQL